MTGLDMDVMMDAVRYLAGEDRTAVDAAHRMHATEMKTPWIPYPPEIVSDWTGWSLEEIQERFGDTVLVRHSISGIELRRGEPDPAQARAEVTDIIARGRRDG